MSLDLILGARACVRFGVRARATLLCQAERSLVQVASDLVIVSADADVWLLCFGCVPRSYVAWYSRHFPLNNFIFSKVLS